MAYPRWACHARWTATSSAGSCRRSWTAAGGQALRTAGNFRSRSLLKVPADNVPGRGRIQWQTDRQWLEQQMCSAVSTKRQPNSWSKCCRTPTQQLELWLWLLLQLELLLLNETRTWFQAPKQEKLIARWRCQLFHLGYRCCCCCCCVFLLFYYCCYHAPWPTPSTITCPSTWGLSTPQGAVKRSFSSASLSLFLPWILVRSTELISKFLTSFRYSIPCLPFPCFLPLLRLLKKLLLLLRS